MVQPLPACSHSCLWGRPISIAWLLCHVSVHADDLKWLQQQTLAGALRLLPRPVRYWLTPLVQDNPVQEWKPFYMTQYDSSSSSTATGLGEACMGQAAILSWGQISGRVRTIDARLDLTLTCPVKLAKLRWALHEYQAQLQHERQGDAAAQRVAAQADMRRQADQDERAAAKRKVQKVYVQCKLAHDVHKFADQLRARYPALDVDKLGEKPSSDKDSFEWKSSVRIISGNAIKMVHPDKAAAGTTPKEEVHALEMCDVLLQWTTIYV